MSEAMEPMHIKNAFSISLLRVEDFLRTKNMAAFAALAKLPAAFLSPSRVVQMGASVAVATHYATMINGIDELAITNLDGLDGVNPISICVGYRLNGKRLDVPPCDSAQWNNCEPIYETMPGWSEPTRSARKFSDLPKRARDYLNRISALTGAKLTIVSVGPTRAETIML